MPYPMSCIITHIIICISSMLICLEIFSLEIKGLNKMYKMYNFIDFDKIDSTLEEH